jgi:hypothetical protein
MVLYNDSYIEIYVHYPQLFSDRKESFHIYIVCIMAGTSYLLRKISRELGRYRDSFEQRKSFFPGPSAEENVIFLYECTSYKTRLSCVVKTILPLIDLPSSSTIWLIL